MTAYMGFQAQAMEQYKWIQSEKEHKDIGQWPVMDWEKEIAPQFSAFWKRTHVFIREKNRQEAHETERPSELEVCSF